MKSLILGIFLALFLASAQVQMGKVASQGSQANSDRVKFSLTIPYTSRPIMLIFDSNTCPYCKKMKREINEDPELKRAAKGIDIYRIPRDEQHSYSVLGVPTTTQNLLMLYKVKGIFEI